MEQNARAQILNAAEARLLASGPAGLVLDAVAADAGISKGGLLYHFPNKEALVGSLCDRMLARFDEELVSLSAADPERPGAWTRPTSLRRSPKTASRPTIRPS